MRLLPVIGLLAFAAAASAQTVTPTGTLTATPTPTDTPTLTSTPTATITPYATPTPIGIPQVTPGSLGALVVLMGIVAWLAGRSTRRR
jgi:hypothetical protein